MNRRLHIKPDAFRSKTLGTFDNYTRTADDVARQTAITRQTGYAFKETRMPDTAEGVWCDVFDLGADCDAPDLSRLGVSAVANLGRRELCIPITSDRFSIARWLYYVFLCALMAAVMFLAILSLHVGYPSRYPHPIEYVASAVGRKARYTHS